MVFTGNLSSINAAVGRLAYMPHMNFNSVQHVELLTVAIWQVASSEPKVRAVAHMRSLCLFLDTATDRQVVVVLKSCFMWATRACLAVNLFLCYHPRRPSRLLCAVCTEVESVGPSTLPFVYEILTLDSREYCTTYSTAWRLVMQG